MVNKKKATKNLPNCRVLFFCFFLKFPYFCRMK